MRSGGQGGTGGGRETSMDATVSREELRFTEEVVFFVAPAAARSGPAPLPSTRSARTAPPMRNRGPVLILLAAALFALAATPRSAGYLGSGNRGADPAGSVRPA